MNEVANRELMGGAAFVVLEVGGAATYVLLLLHFVGALPFWTP